MPKVKFNVLDSAMRKLFDLKVIFIAIFLLLTIAIKNSENFQFGKLRDLDDGVSDSSIGRGATGKQTTKVRFPFRKLEKSIEEDDDDDDDDEDDEDDDDNDSEEDSSDYTFAKVRKPTFEVKKRTNLRFSKLAQFRDPKDSKNDDDDHDDDDDDDEKISFFSKVLNFFKSKPKETVEESESKDESAEEVDNDNDDNDDDDDEEVKKPLLTEIFDNFKNFLEARNKQKKIVSEAENSDEVNNGDDDHDDDDDDDDSKENDQQEADEDEKEDSESKLKISIKQTLSTIFNRKPFNLVFDFDDSDDETQTFEDSEEDEINYQRLLKEEQEQEKEHTEQLIKQTSDEESAKPEPAPEPETPKAESKKSSLKPKKEKRTKEEAHLAQREFEKLLLNLPSFVPDYSKVRNPECQKQGEVFQRQLRGQRIWALQMMDANAKIPSGLMRGNTNQLGDFDLCTKISQKIKISNTNSMKMKGKYCLANIDVVAAADQLKLPVHLIQGRNFIRSTINDVSLFS